LKKQKKPGTGNDLLNYILEGDLDLDSLPVWKKQFLAGYVVVVTSDKLQNQTGRAKAGNGNAQMKHRRESD
jgi:hypothetical protein